MIYVLDTNIILQDTSLSGYKGETVYIPIEVYKELDKQKTKEGFVGFASRQFHRKLRKIENFDEIFEFEGVSILMPNLDLEDIDGSKIEKADDWFVVSKILDNVEYEAHTSDFSLFNLMKLKGKRCRYIDKQNTLSEVTKSYKEVYVDEKIIKDIDLFKDFDEYNCNDYLLLINTSNPNNKRLVKIRNRKLIDVRKQDVYGVQSKNIDQTILIDSLLDKDIKVVILSGFQGSGKSFISLATALDQIDKEIYGKILLSKSQAPVSKHQEVGFLPGTLEDKYTYSMGNYFSNLEALHNGSFAFEKDGRKLKMNGKELFEYYKERDMIDFLPLDSIIGCSFDNKFILVDEAQSIDKNTMRSILTRINDNCKLVFMGDMKQLTCGVNSIDESGLYLANKLLTNLDGVQIITLNEIERGNICKNIAERLNKYGI